MIKFAVVSQDCWEADIMEGGVQQYDELQWESTPTKNANFDQYK